MDVYDEDDKLISLLGLAEESAGVGAIFLGAAHQVVFLRARPLLSMNTYHFI